MPRTDLYDLSVEWDSRDEGSQSLLDAIPTEVIEENEVLYQQAKAPVEFSIVRHGKVEVAKQAQDGSKSILKILGSGEPVGAMAVVKNFQYPATVKALEETIVYRISAQLLPKIQEEAPGWWSDCLGTAAERIVDLADRLESINTQDISQRLSKELCKMAEKHGDRSDGDLSIKTKLTRQMLADLVGCRVESAVRVMSKWEKNGVINTEKSKITIKKPEKVYSLAGESPPVDL